MVPAPPYHLKGPQPTVFTKVRPRPYIQCTPDPDPSAYERRPTREEACKLVTGWQQIPLFHVSYTPSDDSSQSETPEVSAARQSGMAIIYGNRVELPYGHGQETRLLLEIPDVNGWDYASYPYARALLTPVTVAADVTILPVFVVLYASWVFLCRPVPD